MKIKSIKKNLLEREKIFYDITVDIHHNFIINRNSLIITHNSSLSNAIINLAQKFKNNLPLLEEDGQFGSLRSPGAGAPRYIGTKLSPIFKILYKDFELLEYKWEEGEKIEPKYFLPIIPVILINGSFGVSVGFASNILTRDPVDIIDACISIIKGKKIKAIKPSLNSFSGDYIQDSENHKKWIIRGKFQRVNLSTIKVTELPPSLTFEKYEDILDRLVESKEIVSYDDNSKNGIEYTIKFTRSSLESLKDSDIIKLLKLEEYQTENLTTLDEWGKLKIFDRVEDIIEYFVNFRLEYYKKRKDYNIQKMENNLFVLDNKIKFLKLILENKIKINGVDKSKILLQLEKWGLGKVDDSWDYLLRMSISSLTKDVFDNLVSDLSIQMEELSKYRKISHSDMYLDDLSKLKSDIIKYLKK